MYTRRFTHVVSRFVTTTVTIKQLITVEDFERALALAGGSPEQAVRLLRQEARQEWIANVSQLCESKTNVVTQPRATAAYSETVGRHEARTLNERPLDARTGPRGGRMNADDIAEARALALARRSSDLLETITNELGALPPATDNDATTAEIIDEEAS